MTEGSVHGRFQIFHAEHLEYVQLALAQVDFLHIGITGVKGFPVSVGSKRLTPEANPLSYSERSQMIRSVLASEGVASERFAVTPFPIECPELLLDFVSAEVRCFTTVREPWNLKKVSLLEELGYEVVILRQDYNKRISGTRIRALLAAGDPTWRDHVPAQTAMLVEQWRIRDRLPIA